MFSDNIKNCTKKKNVKPTQNYYRELEKNLINVL